MACIFFCVCSVNVYRRRRRHRIFRLNHDHFVYARPAAVACDGSAMTTTESEKPCFNAYLGCQKSASSLACPTCKSQNFPPAHFCGTECFKKFWPLHKLYHAEGFGLVVVVFFCFFFVFNRVLSFGCSFGYKLLASTHQTASTLAAGATRVSRLHLHRPAATEEALSETHRA